MRRFHRNRHITARPPKNSELHELLPSVECGYLGPKLTSTRPACGARVLVPINECSKYGKCTPTGATLGKEYRSVRVCGTCPHAKHNQLTVGVAVLCHNYEQYLDECLSSIDGYDELIVIDIASDVPLEREGVRIRRLEENSLGLAKQVAVDELNTDLILHVDADNKLTPGYIATAKAALLDAHSANPAASFAYPVVERFGAAAGRIPQAGTLRRGALHGTNYADTCSLFFKSAWQTVDPINSTYRHGPMEDRYIWNSFLEAGFVGIACSSVLLDRAHELSMTAAGATDPLHFEDEVIQVIVPFSGKVETFWRIYNEFWIKQNQKKLHPTFLFTSTASINEVVRELFSSWPNATFAQLDFKRSLASLPRAAVEEAVQYRMCSIWNRAQELVCRPYVLTLEDDVLLPQGWRATLTGAFASDIGAVAAPYRQRHGGNKHFTHWHNPFGLDRITNDEGTGVEQVDGAGFGATLLTRELFTSIPFVFEKRRGLPPYYDPQWWDKALHLSGKRLVVAWDALAEHETLQADLA